MFIKRSRDQYAAAHLKNVQFIGGDGWWWEVSGLTWWTSAGQWVWGCQALAASYTCCGSLTGDVYGTSSSSTYYQIVLKYKKILLCLCLYKFLGQQLLITMNSSKTRMSNCLLAVTKIQKKAKEKNKCRHCSNH